MIERMVGNWMTSVLGLLAGAYLYIAQQGLTLPTNKEELKTFGGSLLIALLGLAAKDATTGSQPGATS